MCYLVLDTESSLCQRHRCRVLVSLAYEVVDATGRVHASHYDVVRQPVDHAPDPNSVAIHGITPERSRVDGRPLADVLARFFDCLGCHRPRAIVGHDVVTDVNLIVSEAVRAACSVPAAGLLGRLICTRRLAADRCAIPLHAPGTSGRGGVAYKWPSLAESYRILVEQGATTPPPVHRAHDARGDVERCRAVFVELLKAR